MPIDKNNGMSEDDQQSVEPGHSIDPIGLELDPSAEQVKQNAKEIIERELIRRLSLEKHRLAAEMEIKFKEAGVKRTQAQEQKFKEVLAQEKQKFEQTLKEKYNRVMKTMLHERGQQLAEKVKQEHYATDIELRQQLENLKQELAKQQQTSALEITEATLNARKEQEKASRTLYDNVMQSTRDEIIKQTEERLRAEFLHKELEIKREHEIKVKKHTAKLMNEYEARLRDAIYEQEQAYAKNNNEQLARQSDLFNHRIQQEVATAVAAATSKLELEFVREKQSLNAIIENMRPEIEANRLRMRVEVEKEVREEFDIKYAQYKQKVDQAKYQELEAMLTTEKQKLAEAMQEENMVVLRYKEREIREGNNVELEQKLQAKMHQALQEQEKRLRAEHQQQLEQTASKLKADHALQLQAEVIQERARVAEKSTSEKKVLLQQQQTNLQEQYASETAHKLAMQAQAFKQQYEVQITNLETRLQELMSQRSMKQAHDHALAVSHSIMQPPLQAMEQTQDQDPFNISTELAVELPNFDAKLFEGEKQAALHAQERALRAEYEHKLRIARAEWEQENRGLAQQSSQEDLIACEQRLRKEFQRILEQQRLQAAAKFAKQRDLELRGTVARYKQKILNELETTRVNDLAAAEEALKEQYAARMQQHAELSRVEIERVKDQLIAEQAQKIKSAVELQIEVVQKEQERKFAVYAHAQDEKLKQLIEEERKKINIKFAQDKANLIKDLTGKFTREKHIAMNKYETELREKLYKEMVKQKDFIQSKFSHTQDAALQEQKRRLEAQHKHEIERIKQGFFDPEAGPSKHAAVIAERNVEQLADRILAKFEK